MDEVIPQLCEVYDATQKMGLYAAGFISYEAAPAFDSSLPGKTDDEFPLMWFGLFRKPDERDTLPKRSTIDPASLKWEPSVTQDEYRRCFHSIREYIRNGDTYQVNLTYRLRAKTEVDPWELFVRIMADHEAPYAAYVDTGEWAALSASPELFFRLDGDRIESCPMKGTAARGLWYEDDRGKAEALRSSEKERAENVMIADMVRNDLGRIAVCGSVHVPSLFSVEKYPTVWQMTSTVRAQTHAPLDQILRAISPPASITGAPKRRAMEIIAELESSPRRIYTGAIGFVAPGHRSQFNVAIRTILLRRADGSAEYGVGGGIVWDSTSSGELEECSVKARVLRPGMPDFDLLETMLWSPVNGFSLLEYHLKRLVQSADYFGFNLDLPRIREKLESLATGLPATPHRIRLLVARNGSFRCDTSAFDPGSMHFADILLAKSPVDSNDLFLYHKTTHRRIYEDALRMRPGSADVLMFNEMGEITESTFANVAFEIDGLVCTPPLRCGLLPGTYRAWMLDRAQVQERSVTIEDALRSPNVYLMNSVRGMQRVRIIPPEEKR
jgi:para-aminobenzoate synthetase/4-amino-4-deoxychorismate lyase